MATITIKRARELLGDKTYRLSDAEIQAKIDTMMILANRCYDIIEAKHNHKHDNENPSQS